MLAIILRLFAIICVAVGLLHISLGLGAEQLLGAALEDSAVSNASLDSQNRFYGSQFMLVGAVSWICAGDLERHVTLFRVMLAVFFIGGIARMVSAAFYGLPSPLIQVLALSEIVAPPALYAWHAWTIRKRKIDKP